LQLNEFLYRFFESRSGEVEKKNQNLLEDGAAPAARLENARNKSQK
jgi:hypothetical protein